MGSKVSKKDINDHFRLHFEMATKNSNTEEEFENYFKKKAKNNGINLDDKNINSMFKEVLKEYLEDFRVRKENQRLKKEQKELEKQRQKEIQDLQKKQSEEIERLVEANNLREMERQKEKEDEQKRREEENERWKEEKIEFQSQLQKEREMMEEKIKQKDEEFQKVLNDIIKKNAESQKTQEEYEKMISDIKKKAEEDRKNFEQQLINEKDEKIKKINEDFNKEVEIEIDNEIKQLFFEFKKEENSFCLENVKKFEINKLQNSIKALFKNEEIGKKIKEKVKLHITKLVEEPKRRVNHLNILVLGISGVGKSTLVETILGIPQKSNKTLKEGFFRPQTKGKPTYYESKVVPFIRLADTQGIEISSNDNPDKYGIDEVEKDVTDFIKENDKSGIPDKYVHCIWYCFNPNSSRFQDDEEKLLVKLSNDYSIETLPIILVGTQSNSMTKVNQFIEHFKTSELKIHFDFIPVMARKLDNTKSFGLDKLQNTSIEKSMKAIKSKCYQGILEDVKTFFLNILETKSEELIETIEKYKEQCLKEISKGVRISDLKTQIIDLFIVIFKRFNNLLDEKESNENAYKLKEQSIDCISKFIDDYFNFCLKDYILCLNDFVKDNTEKIAITINDFQNNYKNTHGDSVYVKTIKQWQNILRERIINEFQFLAEIYCNKNAFKFLADLLILNFKNVYITTYIHIVEGKTEKTKDINELIESKITKQFQDIYQKIKDYQEKVKLEEERKKKEEEEKRKREEEKEKKEREEEKKRKEEEEKRLKSKKEVENGGYDPEDLI